MIQTRTEVEWRFASPDVLQAWRPNNAIAEMRFENEAMRFRTIGDDPILEYVPLLNLQALPHQAIEIELKASTPGVAELFWSNTTESPYGGFLPEKRNDFVVVGDGQWHTYRVFPFWQREGRIVRLRFDPFGFGQFDLRAIRIVRLEGLPVREGQREFRFQANRTDWVVWRGAQMHTMPNGVRVQLTEPGGFIGGRVSIEAERFPVVAVRLRSSGVQRCALVYATTEAYGTQQYTFDLIPDGKSHLYNIDMLDARGWGGEVVMLGICPGERVGDAIVVEGVQLASEPMGMPEIQVLFFGIEDALPRTETPLTLLLRAKNRGGQHVKGLKVSLQLPPAARLLQTVTTPAAELSFAEEAVGRWLVSFSRPYQGHIAAKVVSANTPVVQANTRVALTPRLMKAKLRTVPPPTPVIPKYPVGVYYFPGWRSAGQWAPITRFAERKPVLGWYREGDPQIADWHIKWAVEHGITFFVYDWYWVQGARQLEHALHEGYFQSNYRRYLQFCLLWANHNPPGTSSHEDCLALVRHWIAQYFHRPEHLRIEGKPAVIIFSPYQLRADMGSDGVRRALDAMREECVKEGLGGLYILACIGGAGEVPVIVREGYDAVTAYTWPYLGVSGDTKWAPFDTLIEGYRQVWESIVQNSPIPLLPPICGGWDSRPWHGRTALVRYGRTPEKFKKHLQDALRLLQTYPNKVLPMALIEAWNEWGEGSYIEPHREFGFGYLDAIREVFTTAAPKHVDLTPADIGIASPQVEILSFTQPKWQFTQSALGWDHGMLLNSPRIEGNALTAVTAGNDPAFFGPPVQISARRYRRIRVRMRLEAQGQPFEDIAQVFWTTQAISESEATSVRFPVRVDGRWHDYLLTVAENPRWRGVITRMRLDPCTRIGVKVQIALIELLP